MQEKKIATSVDLLINVGQYEHLQITKYAETKIEYATSEEMVMKEDQLTDELVKDVIRTMRSIPEKLGKKADPVNEIEEKIIKKIPEWLENGAEPNLAKKKFEEAKAKESARVEAKNESTKESSAEIQELLGNSEEKTESPSSTQEPLDDELFDIGGDDEDLFDDK